jgi:hypothetical protein
MRLKNLQLAGSLLSLSILAMLVWYRSSPLYLPGALYLVAAGYLNLFAVVLVAGLRKKQRSGSPEPAAWAIRTKASVLTLAGWQVAIVALLNLWQSGFSGSLTSVIMGYLLTTVFAVVWFKLVRMADSSEQEGGSKPFNYFGRPRPRWIFFCAFLYTPTIPLIIANVELSEAQWCPVLLRLPQFWLLVVTFISVASTGLIFHRYRRAAPNKTWAVRTFIATLLGLGVAGLVQVVWGYSLAVYLLSLVSVACVAASAYWLSLAREGTAHEVHATQ